MSFADKKVELQKDSEFVEQIKGHAKPNLSSVLMVKEKNQFPQLVF